MYGNIIWFECKSENIIVSLETDLRPVVGDKRSFKRKEL